MRNLLRRESATRTDSVTPPEERSWERAIICIANALRFGVFMKTTTIPPLRVSPDLRKEAEAVLEDGETLSGFLLDAVTRSIEHRKARQEFIARGMASATKARKSGKYVSAD